MSTSKERVLNREKERGKALGYANAQAVQEKAAEMTSDELYGAVGDLPGFKAAVKKENMLTRKAGIKDGFVCLSTAGTVSRLLQNYDSDIFTGEPEELPAQWGRVWSNAPALAKDFVSDANSPYHTGNCCKENGICYRSLIDNNVYAPSDYPEGWEVTE